MSESQKKFIDIPFAERFRDLMQDTNDKELSAALGGISPSAFRQWSNGYTLPTCENLRKLAMFFNVSSDYLLGIDEADTHSAQSIEDATGLSIPACKKMDGWNSNRSISYIWRRSISFLIEHGVVFLETLYKYLFYEYAFTADIENAASFGKMPDDTQYYASFPLVTFSEDHSEGRSIVSNSEINDMHLGMLISQIIDFRKYEIKESKQNGKHN